MYSRVPLCFRQIHYSAVRKAGTIPGRGPLTFPGWYPRDHMPDEYPTTEEKRRAAAIKYGLRPEDYKPISPDNVVDYAGDYPDLGFMTYDNRDPYEMYSYPHERRNWGEPVQMSYMLHRADRNSYTGLDIEDFTFWNLIKYSTILMVPMFLFFLYNVYGDPNKLRHKNPKMPKQYAYDYYPTYPYGDPTKYPIVNYTFEPAE